MTAHESKTTTSRERPNIVMIVADSIRASALSVYGNRYTKTPHIDQLYRQGIAISEVFCAHPKCVPNRAAMLTGRYPHTDGLRALRGKSYEKEGSDHFVITSDMPSALSHLKHAGYKLCHKGTNHIVSEDYYASLIDYGMDWDQWKERVEKLKMDQEDPALGRAMYGGRIPDDYDLTRTPDSETTRQAEKLITDYSHSDPFFAYVDLRSPHPIYWEHPIFEAHYNSHLPQTPKRVDVEKVPWTEKKYRETYDLEGLADNNWQRIAKAYATAISYTDSLVGRILDTIKSKGIASNTTIILTSDHGDFAGEHGCIEKHDTLLYDSLVRVPLIIAQPDTSTKGVMVETMSEQIDIAPTILELCGIAKPDSMHGKSMLPLILGTSIKHKGVVFAQGGVELSTINRTVRDSPKIMSATSGTQHFLKQKVIVDHPEFMMRAKMIRTHDHKLIYRLNGHHEFYDLKNDADELHNEYDNPIYTPIIASLKDQLMKHLIEHEPDRPNLEYALA